MRILRYLITGIIVLCLFPGPLKAQNLYVMEHSGEQTSFVINDIGKLYFTNGDLIVQMQGGTSEYYPLADIRYLNFTDLVQVIENVPAENTDISLYPNPVRETLHIAYSLPGANVVRLEIVSSDGRLVYRETIRRFNDEKNYYHNLNFGANGLYGQRPKRHHVHPPENRIHCSLCCK